LHSPECATKFLPNVPSDAVPGTPDVATLPSPGELSEAMTAQLGLRLEPTRAPIDMLVITSINQPTPN
jgi:uncharacterized protein (TIGR03435 family)